MPEAPILIAYDGSDNAAHAIRVAGELLGGGPAHVVHAWEPVSSAATRSAVYAIAYDDTPEILHQEQEKASAVAEAGVDLARAAGFEATGVAVSGSGPIWQTLTTEIETLHPRLVVMGTRGLTGVRGALTGHVSHQLTAHSCRPVLIVPPADHCEDAAS